MTEQTLDIKRRLPEGAIFVPQLSTPRLTLGGRLLRILRFMVRHSRQRLFDLSTVQRQPVNLKPARSYDWGRWYKPQVASLRREWFAIWSVPRHLPLLLLAATRRCFVIFLLVALSFYFGLGGGNVFATSWQKQQELAPLALQVVTNLETALANVFQGNPTQARQILTATRQQLTELRAGFGGINLAAAVLNRSRFGLTLLALQLGDELTSGIEAITQAVAKLQQLELKPALAALERAQAYLSVSLELLRLVDQGGLSDEQIARLRQLSINLSQGVYLFTEVKRLTPLLLRLSGSPDPTKILVLFQNTGEARATGGFIGAFALLGFREGKVDKFTVHDSYDFDGQLFAKVKSPPFLRPYVQNVALRDSNHSPDFPTSARLASWFLEQEKGPTVDAVLALDEEVLRELLTISGPIHLPGWSVTVDAKNFYLLLEYLIETNKDHPQTPKQVLIDLIDQLVARLGEQHRPLVLLETALRLVSQKRLLLYIKDAGLQAEVAALGLSGNFPPARQPKEDFLAVSNTALSGNKSDYFMTAAYSHQTMIDAKGKLTDRFQIERRHRFGKGEEQFIRQQPQFAREQRLSGNNLLNTLGAGRNQELVRVFVPLGSKLLTTHGVSLDEVVVRDDPALNLTSFEFLQVTARGDTSQVALRYELPFYLTPEQYALYRLRFFPQPGQSAASLTKTVAAAGQELFYLDEAAGLAQSLAQAATYRANLELSNDHIFAIIVKQPEI